jgi:L-rhamnose isomerase
VADKVSVCLEFLKRLMIHTSRGVRWDSDHVVILNDDVRALCQEIVRGGALDRVDLALDFFDASINRIAAWVVGARSTRMALLSALLEPTARLRELEDAGQDGAKLAVLQDIKLLPVGAVWDYFCLTQDTPPGSAWLNEVDAYEKEVLAKRSGGA